MGGMGSPDAQARERYRNTLFDREAKAATALLEQVRQYVGRSGKCHDLCTIHHAISNLYERVRRFSNLETMPRVYRSAVKAPPAPQQRCRGSWSLTTFQIEIHSFGQVCCSRARGTRAADAAWQRRTGG
eukprot:g8684.t1